MELLLKRAYKKSDYTIGNLYINDELFCNTLEDKDRSLRSDMQLEYIKNTKVAGSTAIPTGRYVVTLAVQSPKYRYRKAYEFCNGYVPRLLNVKGFEGILMHIGNTNADSSGCILLGKNTVKGAVMESSETLRKLYDKMRLAADTGEEIVITIE
ncbi:MAG: DUF5675 family protein [Prevotellaceae bacterium]|jgi:hypothetical protein|nr:DUF5675 family protein [Prevotellaceae bacterium]